MTRGLLLVPAALLMLAGCTDSFSADDDAGIILRLDGSTTGTDAGPPTPMVDSGPPPPPPVDSGTPPGSDASIPTVPGNVGAGCTEDTECTGLTNGVCQTTVGGGGLGGFTFPGGYCSAECTPGGSECGEGGECFSVGFGGFGFSLCAKRCNRDSDCRQDEGYTCTMPPFIGGGPFCLPPTPGGPGGDGGLGLPDGGFSFPDGGFGLPDGGFGLPDGGFGLPDGGFGLPDGGFSFPDGGFGLPDGSVGLPDGGFGLPDSGGAPDAG
ncbi:MAG: hypothetical protein AB8I08_29490 [Sandaracinaceae bacterium]